MSGYDLEQVRADVEILSRAAFNFPDRACEHCTRSYTPRSRTQRFCDDCAYVTTTCEHCGRQATRERALSERLPRRFCSVQCKRSAAGGLYLNMGRWFVVCRDGSRMTYARALMANEIGRLLRPDEHVHHVNGDPTDDRMENLRLLSASEHMKLHNPKGKKVGTR